MRNWLTWDGHFKTVKLAFDLAAVTDMDSSCLAVIFGWMRAARDAGKVVRLLNPPRNLLSLAEVYGVSDLLPRH